MDIKTLIENAYAMPICRPAYSRSGARFVDREFLMIAYRSDLEAVRKWVPEPLKVTDPIVKFEVVHMPDSSGMGDYYESGQVIQVELNGALSYVPHALAPLADLPVLEVLNATHMVMDMTLGLGEVVHDYLT
jgi:acetoacetate decarboxylase